MKRFLSIGLLALALGFSPKANAASCAAAQRVQETYWRDRNTGHPAAAAELMRDNEWAFAANAGRRRIAFSNAVPYTAYRPYGVFATVTTTGIAIGTIGLVG